jgi:hypothetical protein
VQSGKLVGDPDLWSYHGETIDPPPPCVNGTPVVRPVRKAVDLRQGDCLVAIEGRTGTHTGVSDAPLKRPR